METLRKAMLHTEGPVPGSITLTIARRAPSPGPNRSFEISRNTSTTIINNSSGKRTLTVSYNKIYSLAALLGELYNSGETDPSSVTDNSGASGGSTNTVVFNPHKSPTDINNKLSPINTWNPVIDRLMGHKQLRNESYYKVI